MTINFWTSVFVGVVVTAGWLATRGEETTFWEMMIVYLFVSACVKVLLMGEA